MLTARAALTDGQGKYWIDEIGVAPPQAGEIAVDIRAAGVCHTDFDSQRWGRPLVMGHEGAGVVTSIGAGVCRVQPGDRVLLNWALPCKSCFQCQRGRQALCEQRQRAPLERTQYRSTAIERSFGIGTMSTRTVVTEAAVTVLPDDISFPAAAIMGCGVMTGYGSVVNIAKVTPGSVVVVIGTGGVGLNAVQGARIAGAGRIIAVDVNPGRLEMARRFGATDVLLADRGDEGLLQAAAQVRALNGGRGADYAFESTAIPSLGAAPLAMVCNGGIAVQMSGIEEKVLIDMTLFEFDKQYVNPLYGGCRPDVDFPRLFSLYSKGDLILDELVTRTYALDDLQQAFDDMHAGINAKGVLVME